MMMTKWIWALILNCLPATSIYAKAVSTATPNDYLFQIHGSNTIGEKLGPALVESYFLSLRCQNVSINNVENFYTIVSCEDNSLSMAVRIVSKGSSTGFKAMQNGTAQIVASSRKAKQKEIEMLAHLGRIDSHASENVIAFDAVSIVVNKNNPVTSLSISQLSNLFRGLYKSWDKVGGRRDTVTLFVRDKESGTRSVFENIVFKPGQTFYYQNQSFTSTSQLINAISSDSNAIGFAGYGTSSQSKTLSLRLPSNMMLRPSTESILTEDYPLSRRLYLYMPEGIENSDAQAFMDYVKTQPAQNAIEGTGFIPVSVKTLKVQTSGQSKRYLRATAGYQRLSVTIRFSKSGKSIDSFGMQSLKRISQFMENNKGTLLLVGFYGLSEGRMAREFSAIKAKDVSNALVREGINRNRILVRGLGNRHLIIDGKSKADNMKNIRVEVWFKPWFSGS